MQWERFSQILIEADKKFKQISLDLPQQQSFLKKSSLVITFGPLQFPFKKELTIYDVKSILKLLKNSGAKDKLLYLNDLLESLEDDQKAMVKQKRNEGLKEMSEKIGRIKDEFNSFPLKDLEVDDGIDIQIIFPSITIEAIQTVKNHPLISREKTCSCRACIRAFIY